MARLEAHLAGMPGDQALRAGLQDLALELGGTLSWLDARNATLVLNTGSSGLSVQVLLELSHPGKVGVLVSSREGMGRGAPLSRQALEQVLAGLIRLGDQAVIRFRSDRDGPVRQTMALR
ncbi:hypothetical protein KBZ20_14990 [Vulcanococcus limneticus Candia 3F8]|nr:hypothetical protein [Vulcanococcus limneticus MW73D5]MCP9895079.1 hypothetical protein [Vulcanococcus limneticus Candia 3F8]MCP9898490.1 hypothetical protein [Vulcanococcus limneticus Candia 3B3]